MANNSLPLFAIFCCLICGCGEQSPQGFQTNKENLKIISYLDSSFVIMKYNQEGVMIDSIPYNQDSLVHGIRKELHIEDSFNYYTYMTYLNGQAEGPVFGYFLDGDLYYSGTYHNGYRKGECFFYYESGSLSSYKYYDFKGGLAYFRMYDKDGSLSQSKGEGIGYIEFDTNEVKVNDIFSCKVNVATPPNCFIKGFVADEVDFNGEPIKDKFYEYNVQNGAFIYSTTFLKSGVYEKGFGWLLKDSISGLEETDFKILKIIVIDK